MRNFRRVAKQEVEDEKIEARDNERNGMVGTSVGTWQPKVSTASLFS